MAENKYQRGKIYKIIADGTNEVYVGSTAEPTLARRLAIHRNNHRNWLKGNYSFASSFKLIEREGHRIILLESYPCNSKDELTAREQFWIESTENCVNHRKANTGIPPGLEQPNYQAEYRKINCERLSQFKSQTFECHCGIHYTQSNKNRHERTAKHQKNMKAREDAINRLIEFTGETEWGAMSLQELAAELAEFDV